MMTHRATRMTFKTLARVLLLSTALASAPATVLSQDAAAPAAEAPAAPAPAPDAVVATVGGETITEADIAFAAEDLARELQQMPPADQRAFLVTILIDMKVMAKAAKDAGLDQADSFKRRLRYLEEQSLRRAYFAEKIATGVTEESLKAAYDKLVADFKPVEEVHARHILVASIEEADAIKAELTAGKPFEVLAMEKTIDPSGKQNGGDLGFFTKEMMVKPFADTAFAMEVGQVSDPVMTQFGWHIIKLEEKRLSQPPSLKEVGQQLSQQVMFKAFDDSVGALKKELVIEIPDTALAEGVKRQSQTAGEGAAAQ